MYKLVCMENRYGDGPEIVYEKEFSSVQELDSFLREEIRSDMYEGNTQYKYTVYTKSDWMKIDHKITLELEF